MATNREGKSTTRTNVASGTSGMGAAGAGGQTAGASASGTGNGKAASPGFLGGIQQKVSSRVDEQKNRAADGLGGIANVIRHAGDELRTENEFLASYVESASDALRQWAEQIRRKGVADMLDDVQAFAERRPAVFVGGAFLLGVGLARFLKSSADRRSYASHGDGFSDVDPMTAQAVPPSYGGATGY